MRILRFVTLAGLVTGVALTAATKPAMAQGKGKSTQTEADWIAYDPETQTITVKVRKPGRGKDAKRLKGGKEQVFHVKAEGTVLTKTVVKVNGKAGELTDIPAGKRVLVYWQPNAKGEFFARSIDVVFSEEELDERYPDRD